MTEAAFLAAIREPPDDDTPRLVFSDWLEDRGEVARANFIRLHIAWCRRPADAPPDDDLRAKLLAAGEAAGLRDDTGVYDRGFPAVAWFEDFEHYANEAEATFRTHPIRVAYLYQDFTYEDDLRPLQRLRESASYFRGLVGLGCHSRGWPVDQREVLFLPEFDCLEMLDFHGCDHFGSDIAEAIHTAGYPKLRVLDLSGCQIGDEGLEILADASHLASLRSLRLGVDDADSDNALSWRGIAALTRSPYLVNLTQLYLSCNAIGDEGLSHLLGWPHLDKVTELDLSCCGLSETGLRQLVSARPLDNLRRLDVSVNGTTTPALARELLTTRLGGLRELYIDTGELDAALRHQLRARFELLVLDGDSLVPTPLGEADRIAARVRRSEHSQAAPEERIL